MHFLLKESRSVEMQDCVRHFISQHRPTLSNGLATILTIIVGVLFLATSLSSRQMTFVGLGKTAGAPYDQI